MAGLGNGDDLLFDPHHRSYGVCSIVDHSGHVLQRQAKCILPSVLGLRRHGDTFELEILPFASQNRRSYGGARSILSPQNLSLVSTHGQVCARMD